MKSVATQAFLRARAKSTKKHKAQEIFERKRRAKVQAAAEKEGYLRLSDQEQLVTLAPDGSYLFQTPLLIPPRVK